MDLIAGIFSGFGLSASAGLNAYIPLLTVALIARFTDLFTLAEPYDVLSSWWVIGVLVLLSIVEFVADKVPAVNHANDVVMTIVRPIAGAILFAASAKVITDVNPLLSAIMGLLVSGGVHAVKALAVRPAVSVASAGAANVPVSIAEDVLSTVMSVFAVLLPLLVAFMVLALVAVALWWINRREQNRRSV